MSIRPNRIESGEERHASSPPSGERARVETPLPGNERMAEIIGVLAHQVRNPLGAIKNAAYLLNLSLGETASPDVTQSLSIIHDEVKRANEIITGLLELVRVRPPRVRPTPLAYVVEQALGGQSLTGGRTLTRNVPADLVVHVDPDQTQLALFHLCRHALSVIAPGAALGVSAEASPQEAVVLLADPHFETAEADLDHLVASHPPELSMTLLTARVLVENQGGTVSIARRGRSVSILVHLPRTAG